MKSKSFFDKYDYNFKCEKPLSSKLGIDNKNKIFGTYISNFQIGDY